MSDLHDCIYWMGDLGLLDELGSALSFKKRDPAKELDCTSARDWIFQNWHFMDKEQVKKLYNRCKSKKIPFYPELIKLNIVDEQSG